jgi:hypothetical protein
MLDLNLKSRVGLLTYHQRASYALNANQFKQKEKSFVNKKRNNTKTLREAIKEKELQLAKLKLHVDKSSICSDLYNKVVLEKAILKKDLQDLEQNKFITSVRGLLPRKKVLICDHFKR